MSKNININAGINLTKLEAEAAERGIELYRTDDKGTKWLNVTLKPSQYQDDEYYLVLNLGKEGRDNSKAIGTIGNATTFKFKNKSNFEDKRTSNGPSQFNF